MRLTVNGEEREVAGDLTVGGLIEALGVPAGRVAVEVNLQVIRRAEHASFRLREGDRVEVVTFVGGGA